MNKILKAGASIIDTLSNGILGEVGGLIKSFIPDKTKQKEFELSLKTLVLENKIKSIGKWNEYSAIFNEGIKSMEGTAKDLKSIKVIGPLMILLRGSFRPLFSFFIAYANYQSWSMSWKLTALQDKTLSLLTIIVVVFYFGERAIINILPILESYLGGKLGITKRKEK